jgi:hypothetical protein
MGDPFEHGFRYTTQSGRNMYKWTDAEVASANGKLPEPPDFSANTHEPYRRLISTCVDLARSRDLKRLREVQICPGRRELSSTPTAIKRWRDLCVRALSRPTGATATNEFRPSRHRASTNGEIEKKGKVESRSDAALSIADAKRRLAATFGLKPEAIEITIRA